MNILDQIAEYLYLKKKDPNAPRTQWMKYMHGINRISILLFLFALVVIFIKLVILKKH
ncbi:MULTISPECIES: DUF6728 family protein [unclassified Paraflavitalea]|uniref:DUF6728 family protein n=1 Tax=unclassified Paraflavitalea TaxID=2798305 RepID=UPI003D33C4D6